MPFLKSYCLCNLKDKTQFPPALVLDDSDWNVCKEWFSVALSYFFPSCWIGALWVLFCFRKAWGLLISSHEWYPNGLGWSQKPHVNRVHMSKCSVFKYWFILRHWWGAEGCQEHGLADPLSQRALWNHTPKDFCWRPVLSGEWRAMRLYKVTFLWRHISKGAHVQRRLCQLRRHRLMKPLQAEQSWLFRTHVGMFRYTDNCIVWGWNMGPDGGDKMKEVNLEKCLNYAWLHLYFIHNIISVKKA